MTGGMIVQRTLIKGLLVLALAMTAAPAWADEEISDPVDVPVEGVATTSQVQRAVKASMARRGWVPGREKAGYIEGTLTKGDRYFVRIGVSYDDTKITIRYLDSDGLDYDAEDGTIHSSYNKWMRMLSREIGVNLALFASGPPEERDNPFDPAIVPEVVPVIPMPEQSASAAAPAPTTAPAPAAPASPPASPAPAAAPATAPAGMTVRAGAELRARAQLSAPVQGKVAAATTVAPKGPVRNAEGSWWYVKTAHGAGWVRQADLQ